MATSAKTQQAAAIQNSAVRMVIQATRWRCRRLRPRENLELCAKVTPKGVRSQRSIQPSGTLQPS